MMDNNNAADATDLMIACQSNDVDNVKELLKENASSSAKDPTGKVALHYCAENGNLELVEKVFEGDPSLLDHRDEDGYTPLTFAVIGGNIEVAEFLLNKGADINSVDSEKHSLVHWSVVCGQKRSLELLLRRGALVSLPDIHGSHSIHYATQLCDTQDGLEILQLLLRNGAAIDCSDLDQRTPLLWAASCGSQKAFIALTEAGADKKCIDKDQLSSIHCAASRGHGDLIELVLKLSVDAQIDAKDRNGCSPLFYAATLGHVDCTRTLLKNNAQVNFQDKKLRTAAHCAAAKGQLATLKLLWQHGASFDLGNHRGDLPIHEASQAGSIEVVDFLLHINGNNINASNNIGRTPLHLAAANGDLNLCKYFVDKGANHDALMLSKNELFTSLDIAERKQHNDVVEYLQSMKAKKSNQLPEDIVEDFKRSLEVQVPQKKTELMESMAQTELPEKVDQYVEVEVHAEQPQQLLEENFVKRSDQSNNKVEKHKKKKLKQRSQSADQQSSDEDVASETEVKHKKSRAKSSSSKLQRRSKRQKNKQSTDKEAENVVIVSREKIHDRDKALEELDIETNINLERKPSKKNKKHKSRGKNQPKDNSETDIPPGSASDSKTEDGNSSVVSEPISIKFEQDTSQNEETERKMRKSKEKKENVTKTENPGKLKSKDERTLSMISEEGSMKSRRENEEKDIESAVHKQEQKFNSKSLGNSSRKQFVNVPLVELNLLNNTLESDPLNKKQNAQKILVEQALFTDNLRTKNGGNLSHFHHLSDMQRLRGSGRPSQLSAASRSLSSSARGLYRRHRNRYCETCNLAIPANVNHYIEEKRIFQELANLKRMQIQYGKVQENILVRRMMEDFFRHYNVESEGYHVDTFHAWEKFLYDQLQRLYQREQETVRIKRLQPPTISGESSLFQKRLRERSSYGNKDQIDSLNRIYGSAPIPLQYAPNIPRGRIL